MNDRLTAEAAKYRDRAAEMRKLATQLKGEEHKRLLLKTAEEYENMADRVERDIASRSRR